MKRPWIALCLLFALGAGGMAAVHNTVHAASDRVEIYEEVVFGDKAAAEGITVRAMAELERHVTWDTDYTVGEEPTTRTRFQFFPREEDRIRIWEPRGLEMYTEYNIHGAAPDWTEGELGGINRAYWELYESLEPGESGYKVIYLKDYYEYYPLEPQLDLERFALSLGWSNWEREEQHQDPYRSNKDEVYQALKEYFKIPILPEHKMEISVERHVEDDHYAWGSSTMGTGYSGTTYSEVVDGTCYILLDGGTEGHGDFISVPLDFSQVPGGYGIHAIDFRPAADDSYYDYVDADSLRLVYPMEQTSRPLWLESSSDGERLFLLTREVEGGKTGEYMLRVIRREGMETIQTLTFHPHEEQYWPDGFTRGDNYLLIVGYRGSILLLEEGEDGTLEVKLDFHSDNEEMYAGRLLYTHWDGEKLVIALPIQESDWEAESYCGFDLKVYDKTGPLFEGKYTSSLDTGVQQRYGQNNCELWWDDALEIQPETALELE